MFMHCATVVDTRFILVYGIVCITTVHQLSIRTIQRHSVHSRCTPMSCTMVCTTHHGALCAASVRFSLVAPYQWLRVQTKLIGDAWLERNRYRNSNDTTSWRSVTQARSSFVEWPNRLSIDNFSLCPALS